jgi:hypothetical protein
MNDTEQHSALSARVAMLFHLRLCCTFYCDAESSYAECRYAVCQNSFMTSLSTVAYLQARLKRHLQYYTQMVGS